MAQNEAQARQLAAYLGNTGGQIAHQPSFGGWDKMWEQYGKGQPYRPGVLGSALGQAPTPPGPVPAPPAPGAPMAPPNPTLSMQNPSVPPGLVIPADPRNHMGMAAQVLPGIAPPPDVGYAPPAEVPNPGFLPNARTLQQAGMRNGFGDPSAANEKAFPSFEEWLSTRRLGSQIGAHMGPGY